MARKKDLLALINFRHRHRYCTCAFCLCEHGEGKIKAIRKALQRYHDQYLIKCKTLSYGHVMFKQWYLTDHGLARLIYLQRISRLKLRP